MFLVSKSGPFYNQNPFISEKLSSKNCVLEQNILVVKMLISSVKMAGL